MNAASQTSSPNGLRFARPLHLLALNSLVVAQPLLDLLGRSPDFFVVRQVGIFGIVTMILALMLGPPAAMASMAEVVGGVLGARGRRAIYDVFMALLVAAGLLLSLKRTPALGTWAPIALAGLLGVLFPLVYRRTASVRMFLSVMTVLALVFPAFFLIASPARRLVMSRADAVDKAVASVATIERPVPIVFVVFDELPITSLLDATGAIDAAMFPSFARIGAMSTFFPNVASDSFFTTIALPEILTGLLHREGQLARAEEHPYNLFTLIRKRYDIQALEPLTGLYPRQDKDRGTTFRVLASDLGILYLHLIAPAELARSLPNVTTTWEPFGQHTDRAADFRRFVSELRTPEGPGLIFLHSLLPHHPWFYLPSGKRYDPGLEIYIDGMVDEQRGSMAARWSSEPWAVIQAYQRHLLQVAFADRLLGELLDRIEALDMLDEALVIVTADHGVHFEPGGLVRAPHPTTLESLRRVPLFIKWPDQTTAAVDPRACRLIDLVPTIADLIGAEPSWTFDGHTLAGSSPDPVAAGQPAPDGRAPLPNTVPAVWHDRVSSSGNPFDIGPFHQDLLDRPIGTLWNGEPSYFSGEIDHFDRYHAIDKRATLIPTRITGRVTSSGNRPRAEPNGPPVLALALNGKVAATTIARQGAGEHGFSFMVDEGDLLAGHNELELFAVRVVEGSVSLRAVELVNEPTYTLADDGRIHASSGQVLMHDDGRFEGAVVGLTFETLASRMEIFGWSRDLEGDEAPRSVLVFKGERLVARVGLKTSRLGQRYQLGAHANDGFVLILPIEEAGGNLRFFAFGRDGVTSEIPYERRVLDPTKYNGPFSIEGR